MDYELILKNSFGWTKDKKVLAYIGIWFLISLVSLAGISFILQNFFSGLFSVSSLIKLSRTNFLIEFIQFLVLIFAFVLIVGLIQRFISVLITLKGMNYYKIKTSPFGVAKYIKLILLEILSGILALISYYDRRFMYLFIGIIALWIIGIFAMFFGLIGLFILFIALLLSFFYFFVAIYNSIRLSMASFVFLEKKTGIFDSLRASWNLTQRKAIDIFIAFVIVWIIAMVVSLIASYIGQGLLFLFYPEVMSQGQASLAVLQNIGVITFISGFFSVIIGALIAAFSIYCYAGIYSQIKGK